MYSTCKCYSDVVLPLKCGDEKWWSSSTFNIRISVVGKLWLAAVCEWNRRSLYVCVCVYTMCVCVHRWTFFPFIVWCLSSATQREHGNCLNKHQSMCFLIKIYFMVFSWTVPAGWCFTITIFPLIWNLKKKKCLLFFLCMYGWYLICNLDLVFLQLWNIRVKNLA